MPCKKILLPRTAGNENAAWEKLTQSLRYAQEACAEIGYQRSDDERWNKFAMVLQKLEQQLQQLKVASRTVKRDDIDIINKLSKMN